MTSMLAQSVTSHQITPVELQHPNVHVPAEFHHMVVKQEGYTVGRKDCSIKIEGDQSISRKHATLTVKHPPENVSSPEKLPTLELKDSSKYGTVVNGRKMPLGATMALKPGDTVTFGALNSNSWRICMKLGGYGPNGAVTKMEVNSRSFEVKCLLEYEPMVAACSGLPGKDKQGLKKVLTDLGGHLVSEWTQSCTLLVMKQVNVTAKVIGALVTCRHIVTPAYLQEYLDASLSEGKTALPDAGRFLPPVVERAINQDSALFTIREERKTMLQGKIFVFLSEKQHKRLHTVIGLAGGETVLYTPESCSRDLLKAPQTRVLQSEAADNTQTPGSVAQEVGAILKRHKLRMIAEAELGLAVLTVSTAVYCNPSVPKEGLKLVSCMKDSQLATPTTQRVLAADTQLSGITTPASGRNREPTESPLRRKDQPSVPGSFKSPAPPKGLLPDVSSSRRGDNSVLPPSSGVSLFSKSSASEDQLSEDPFAEPPGSQQRMKRPLPAEDDSRHAVDAPSLEAERKKIKTEAQEVEAVPVLSVKQEVADGPIVAEESGPVTSIRTVKTEVVEEVPDSEAPGVDENANQSQVDDSESSQSQWRQNKKRRRMSEDDDEKAAAVTAQPIVEDDRHVADDLPSLPGFFSKNSRPKVSVKEETTSFQAELPKCLVVVESVSLIQQQPVASAPRKANGVMRNVKNFKNFKKSSYAGQRVLPRIIGGSDLEVHHNMASQASQDMFLPDAQKNSDIDRAEALADELFSVEPRVRRVR